MFEVINIVYIRDALRSDTRDTNQLPSRTQNSMAIFTSIDDQSIMPCCPGCLVSRGSPQVHQRGPASQVNGDSVNVSTSSGTPSSSPPPTPSCPSSPRPQTKIAGTRASARRQMCQASGTAICQPQCYGRCARWAVCHTVTAAVCACCGCARAPYPGLRCAAAVPKASDALDQKARENR